MHSERAILQYAGTTGNLTARIAIHAYGTSPVSWFDWLATRLPTSGDVLEVGAGTGKLWRHVDHSGARLTLADFSPAMCAALSSIGGASVVRCDAGALPFPSGSFDALIANHMLYHVDDPAAVLREFARVLRPGGRLAMALNGPGHMAEVDALAEAMGRPDIERMSPQAAIDTDTAPPLIARSFTDVQVERYDCDLAVPTPGPVLAYLASMTSTPFTPAEESTALALIECRIAATGSFAVHKDTSLITAQRPAPA